MSKLMLVALAFIVGIGSVASPILSLVSLSYVVSRKTAAVLLVSAYERVTNTTAPVDTRELIDIDNLTSEEQTAIRKMYALHITAGTSTNTFSPMLRTSLQQWLVFIGKWIASLRGW